MKIRPLTGQVLVEVLPADKFTTGGIEIPERSLSPEEVQMTHRRPDPPKPVQGVVREIGPWPKTKSGLLQMPEFGRGARVLFGFHAGVKMQRGIGEKLRMVRQEDVLAVLT